LLAIPLQHRVPNQLFDGHSSVRPMARKRAFAYRRCRRVPIALYFLMLTNAHVFRISVVLVSYAIYTLTKTSLRCGRRRPVRSFAQWWALREGSSAA
jgi:hypothetical protein